MNHDLPATNSYQESRLLVEPVLSFSTCHFHDNFRFFLCLNSSSSVCCWSALQFSSPTANPCLGTGSYHTFTIHPNSCGFWGDSGDKHEHFIGNLRYPVKQIDALAGSVNLKNIERNYSSYEVRRTHHLVVYKRITFSGLLPQSST